MHRNSWITLALLACGLLTSASSAHAAVFCGGENPQTSFIWFGRFLTGGTTYTISTNNITGDTVMHLLLLNPNGNNTTGKPYIQVAANDDGIVNSRRSVITYRPPANGNYVILVRSYSNTTSGVADVVINGTTLLTQNPFGGNTWVGTRWAANEAVRVTSTRRAQQNDPLLFLLTDNLSVSQMDDDTGPNFDSVVFASTTAGSNSRIVWGSFPSRNSSNRLTVTPSGGTDTDQDGLSNAIESACGMNPASADGDFDAIWDSVELFGNDGFSYSLGSQWGDSHKRRNIYVEVDAMVDPTNPARVPVPYANLGADMANIFNTDGAIDVYVDASGPKLPYTQNVAMDDCGTVRPCTTATALRTANFSQGSPERQAFFRYVVYGDRVVDQSVTPHVTTCSSGQSFGPGTTSLITLGSTCGTASTNAAQRGTVMHELGHNLGLGHNGNDVSPNFSSIHGSVMNYRFQFPGVHWRTAGSVLASTYSKGASACASCSTSPKQRCIDARALAASRRVTCQDVDTNCDCDVREWQDSLMVDFINRTRPPSSGAGYSSGAERLSDVGGADLSAEPLSPSELAAMRSVLVDNTGHTEEGAMKATSADRWRGAMPDFATSRRGQHARKRIQEYELQGRTRGKDFHVSADGQHVYEKCL